MRLTRGAACGDRLQFGYLGRGAAQVQPAPEPAILHKSWAVPGPLRSSDSGYWQTERRTADESSQPTLIASAKPAWAASAEPRSLPGAAPRSESRRTPAPPFGRGPAQ